MFIFIFGMFVGAVLMFALSAVYVAGKCDDMREEKEDKNE